MEYVFKGNKMSNQLTSLEIEEISRVSKKLRSNILKMIHNSQSGHPGGSLSCIDILNVLFTKCMKHYPECDPNLDYKNRDRFINSLVDEGYLERTIPDSPNSPRQKYVTRRK